jgi:hypothetical protein
MSTAVRGFSAPVAIDVAIALAVSCPLPARAGKCRIRN